MQCLPRNIWGLNCIVWYCTYKVTWVIILVTFIFSMGIFLTLLLWWNQSPSQEHWAQGRNASWTLYIKPVVFIPVQLWSCWYRLYLEQHGAVSSRFLVKCNLVNAVIYLQEMLIISSLITSLPTTKSMPKHILVLNNLFFPKPKL